MPSISTHTPHTRTIDVNGATAVYREASPAANDNAVGNGANSNGAGTETVLLVHCSTGTGGQWKKLIEQLSNSRPGMYRVIAPDLFGYGGSEMAAPDALGLLNRDIALVRALIDKAAAETGGRTLGRVHVVGHSYGGGVALRAAMAATIDAPARIASLTLFEPCLFNLLPAGSRGRGDIVPVARTVMDAAGGTDADRWAAAARFINYWNGQGSWKSMPAGMQLAVAGQMPRVAEDFRGFFANTSDLDPKTLASAIALMDLPLLLMRGARTTVAASEVAGIVARLRPDASFAEIEGAGHMAPLTHAHAVNPHIVRHIRRHGAGGKDVATTRTAA